MIGLSIALVIIIVPITLSISAFKGGFHFANLRFLIKLKRLHDYIVKNGDNELLRELNSFLIDVNVENNKANFFDWLKFGFLGKGKE